MTNEDVPTGYATEGPQTTPGGLEFFAAVPAALPQAYIMFSMNSDPGPGGTDLTQDGIIEAVTKASTTEAAVLLLQKIELPQKRAAVAPARLSRFPGPSLT